jgi:hypothetical protein
MRDQELILRFFALYDSYERYRRPMKVFLNDFMATHREMSTQLRSQYHHLFTKTIALVFSDIGENAFRLKRVINAAVYDSVMTALARSERARVLIGGVRTDYERLLRNELYIAACSKSTGDEEMVNRRMQLAIQAFAAPADIQA